MQTFNRDFGLVDTLLVLAALFDVLYFVQLARRTPVRPVARRDTLYPAAFVVFGAAAAAVAAVTGHTRTVVLGAVCVLLSAVLVALIRRHTRPA